ncbi:MAG: transposase, partial [Patescibacteria group bacterium]
MKAKFVNESENIYSRFQARCLCYNKNMLNRNYQFNIIHRNSQHRFYNKDYIYFITTNTHKRFPFFEEDMLCQLFIANLRLGKILKNFKLFGFIIIPDHVHLMLKPEGKFNISKIMQFLKRHFSRDINFLFNINNEGEIRESRLQGGDYKDFSHIIYLHDNVLKQLKNQFI